MKLDSRPINTAELEEAARLDQTDQAEFEAWTVGPTDEERRRAVQDGCDFALRVHRDTGRSLEDLQATTKAHSEYIEYNLEAMRGVFASYQHLCSSASHGGEVLQALIMTDAKLRNRCRQYLAGKSIYRELGETRIMQDDEYPDRRHGDRMLVVDDGPPGRYVYCGCYGLMPVRDLRQSNNRVVFVTQRQRGEAGIADDAKNIVAAVERMRSTHTEHADAAKGVDAKPTEVPVIVPPPDTACAGRWTSSKPAQEEEVIQSLDLNSDQSKRLIDERVDRAFNTAWLNQGTKYAAKGCTPDLQDSLDPL